ncbi:MAG: polysaccharide deacetylase family protein [Aliishimia sp.]
MTSIDWTHLRAELALWKDHNLQLPLWWRDDDAITCTPQLDRLERSSRDAGVQVHLAVIPAHADETLVDYVRNTSAFRPVVHGWAHVNHAPDGQKSSEFGTPRSDALHEAELGMTRLQDMFGALLEPMFVPPWNRIDPSVINGLSELGYTQLSTYGPRSHVQAAPGLAQLNTHIDPVDWKGTRGLANPELLITKLVDHLIARRNGDADNAEPLGLLTHHLMQDEPTWAFCESLLSELKPVAKTN